jgi:hypothetical protein
LLFSDFINNKLNDRWHVIALFIDFSKAFDTLNLEKLIDALESIGIRGNLLHWFIDYLTDRSILVKIGNKFSVKKYSMSGVPQGSILGPILYLIYVNNMARYVNNCKIYQYADDTVLVATDRNVEVAEKMLQTDFTHMLKWTHDKDLVINVEKTKLMHICSPFDEHKDRKIEITVHSHACLHEQSTSRFQRENCDCVDLIENVNRFTYLGLTIDKHFTWKPHINTLCKKMRSCAFQLYNLKYILPFSLLRSVYIALTESIITYGILAWGNATKTHIQQITLLQTKILRRMIPDDKREVIKSVAGIYEFCRVLPVNLIYEFRLYLQFYFTDTFRNLEDPKINTRARSKGIFQIPKHNNKHGKRTLRHSIPTLFNQLPTDMKTIKSYKCLKLEMKKFMHCKLRQL